MKRKWELKTIDLSFQYNSLDQQRRLLEQVAELLYLDHCQLVETDSGETTDAVSSNRRRTR